MITADERTWPLCIVCNDGTRIAPYWVSRKVMRLVAGSGFGVRSVWACGRHSEEEIATVKARLRVVDGVAIMQSEMELGV